jgi:hypothetical protein
MPNLALSSQHTLLSLTGLALTGFLALTYLAFHQPMFYQATAVLAANGSKATSDTMVSYHQSHHPLSHPNSHQNQRQAAARISFQYPMMRFNHNQNLTLKLKPERKHP